MSDLRSAPVPPLRPDDHVRGPADAPLTIFYGDFACPRCAVAAQELASDANARVAFRHLALKAKHARAVPLALAVEAAARQGAFWAFHDALYADQGHIDDPDVERFQVDRRAPELADKVRDHVREALRAGATATPTLYSLG